MISTRTVTATLLGNGASLQVIAGTLQMDESQSPFVSASLTVAYPGISVMAALSPVAGQQPPRLTLTIRRSTGSSLSTTLNVQARQLIEETGEVGINLVNDESLVQDWSPSAPIDMNSSQYSVLSLCQGVLTRALGREVAVNMVSGANPTFRTFSDVKNLIPGGSFEVSSGVWAAARADLSISTNFARVGSNSLRIKPNGTGVSYVVLPVSLSVGQQYTMTAYTRLTAVQTGTLNTDARRLTAVATVNGVEMVIARSDQAPNSVTTTKLTMTFTVPAGADNTLVRIMNGAQNTADNSLYVDAVMLVEGNGLETDGTPLDFFDGNTPDSAAYNYDWDDVAGLSTASRTAIVSRSPDALVWQPGTNAMSFLQPILQATGRRLFQHPNGSWYLTDDNYRVAGQARISSGTNLYNATDLTSRTATQTDGLPLFVDAVVYRYEWIESGTGKAKTATDFAGPTNYSKPYMPDVIQGPYPGPGRAAYVLKRLKSRLRQLQVTGASDYSVRPGMDAVITTPNAGVQTGYVDAVQWDLGNDTMQVVTKGLLAVTASSVGNAPVTQTIGSVSGTIGTYTN